MDSEAPVWIYLKKSASMKAEDETGVLTHLRENKGDVPKWAEYSMFLLREGRYDDAIRAAKEIAARSSAADDPSVGMHDFASSLSNVVIGFAILRKALAEATPYLETCNQSSGVFNKMGSKLLKDMQAALDALHKD